jgi:hypothetical protein
MSVDSSCLGGLVHLELHAFGEYRFIVGGLETEVR